MIKKRKYKNDDGTVRYSSHYYYSFYIKGYRYRGSCNTSSRQEALLVAENIRKKAFEKVVLNIKNPSFEELVNYFLVDNQRGIIDKSKETKNKYELAIRRGLQFFKNKEFNMENTYNFFSYVQTQHKLSESSVYGHLAILNVICNYCSAREQMPSNFIEKMDLKSYKVASRKERVRFLSKNEYESLIKASNYLYPSTTNYIYFALKTGLRLKELLDLSQDKIYLANKAIYIDKTKTDSPRRLRLLDNKLIEILEQNKHLEQPFKVAKSTLNSRWIKILQRAKIENFKWHDLRHTFASWAIMGWHEFQNGKKMSLPELQKYMGHKDIKMTMRYAHLDDDF